MIPQKKLFDDLTLIMLTCNRHEYAIRGMKYWSSLGIKVHVLDGTNEKISDAALQQMGASITYHHMPLGYYDRVRAALSLVKSKYSSFICDDEFFFPSGLTDILLELEKDSDLVSCGGQAIYFSYVNGVIKGGVDYPQFNGFSLLSDDPSVRMINYLSNYVPATYYAITRTDFWKRALQASLRKEFPVYAVFELQQAVSIAYFGKVKMLDSIYWARSLENIPVRGTDISLHPSLTLRGWWRDSKKSEEINQFLDITAKSLVDNCREEFVLVRENLKLSLEGFVVSGETRQRNAESLNKCLYFFKNKFKSILRRMGFNTVDVPLSILLNKFSSSVADRARADINYMNNYLSIWYSHKK